VKVRAGGRLLWWLAIVLVLASGLFTALTVAVASGSSPAVDSGAFRIADQLRAPWLDHVARLVTTLGLLAVVAPVVLIGAALLIRRHHGARACALIAGVALTWVAVWITKAAVDRPRPPASLVHTTGKSFPSGHAANSVGWLALAIALSVLSPTRGRRVVAIAGGALIAILVGLSRIYLRAHYLSDVLAGEALAIAIYTACWIAALMWQLRRASRRSAGGEQS
jgi:membrane-associated phospholipid phosphatase